MIDFDNLLNAPLQNLFGEPVIYARPQEPSFPIRGIFDRKHVSIEFVTGADMSGEHVTLRVRQSEFPLGATSAQGDRVQLRNATWFVQDVQPLGEGESLLVLSARNPLDT